MLDKIDTVQDPATERVLSHIHSQALAVAFTDVVPTTIPAGKLVIYDNGVTRTAYIKTGQGTIVHWTLTA